MLSFRELIARDVNIVIDKLTQDGDLFVQTIIGHVKGEAFVMQSPCRDEQEHRIFLSVAKANLIIADADSYVVIFKAFYAANKILPKPSEGLIVCGVSETDTFTEAYKIERDLDDKITKIILDVSDNGGQGAIFELLTPKHARTPEMKKQAEQLLASYGMKLTPEGMQPVNNTCISIIEVHTIIRILDYLAYKEHWKTTNEIKLVGLLYSNLRNLLEPYKELFLSKNPNAIAQNQDPINVSEHDTKMIVSILSSIRHMPKPDLPAADPIIEIVLQKFLSYLEGFDQDVRAVPLDTKSMQVREPFASSVSKSLPHDYTRRDANLEAKLHSINYVNEGSHCLN